MKSSPIQTWSPMVNRHGKVILVPDRITKPLPIFAPKSRKIIALSLDGTGNDGTKNKHLAKIQNTSTILGRPRSKLDRKEAKSNAELIGVGSSG